MNPLAYSLHFKQKSLLLVIVILLASILSGCSPDELSEPSDDGPQAWVEYPFDGDILPLEPTTLVVYAAGSAGINTINIKVNGVALPAGQMDLLTSDGSRRVVRADLVWQPPMEGEYTITADAGGAPSSSTFCIVTCQPGEVEEVIDTEPTATDTAALPVITLPPDNPTWTPTGTVSPAPALVTGTPTPTQQTYTPPSAEFWAAPDYINSGECATLNWNVYGDFQAVYFEGAAVSASGSDSECPAESHTYHLQVVDMNGAASDYWASVDVSSPPPADSSGPSINWANVVIEGCQMFGQAGISDESGVGWAQFYFNKNSEGWGSIWMQEISAEFWEMEVGVMVSDETVSIDYYVVTADSLGNESESDVGNFYSDNTGCGGY